MNGEPSGNVCRFCPSAFGSANDRKRHEERAHGKELEMAKRLECDDCEKDFATPQALGAHRWRAHGLRSGQSSGEAAGSRPERLQGGGVDVEQQPEGPEAGTDRVFEHCDHVQRCVVVGITECGADPCNLVDELIETRCDDRTPASCTEDPCHDCGIYPKSEEQLGDGRAPSVVNLVIDGGDKYRLEAIMAWATVASDRLMLEGADHADCVEVLGRIKALAS